MSSFYGGKQGRTYHIVARYDCVDLTNYETDTTVFEDFHAGTSYTKGKKIKNNGEYYVVLADSISTANDLTDEEKVYHVRGMIQQFAKGGAYTEANYGEYVLIDTIFNLNHKSDLENGLLYRRGFDYNEDPNLNPKPNINEKDENNNFIYYDKDNHLKKDLWQAAWDTWVQKPGAGAIYVGQIVGPQGDSPEITPVKWEELTKKDLVGIKKITPASTTKGNDSRQITDDDGHIIWNGDAIKVASLTEKDDDGNVTGAQIAFDIPQTIFDPPNINLNGTTYQGVAIEDAKSEDHPFYYKWNFYIPQATDFNLESGSNIISQYNIDGQGRQIQGNDEYITYKVHNANGIQQIEEHLGRWPYRVIDDITLSTVDRYQNPITIRQFITFDVAKNVNIGDLYNFSTFQQQPNGKLICAVCVQAGTIDPNQLPKASNNTSVNYILGYQSKSNNTIWRVVEIQQTVPANSLTVQYKAGPDTPFLNKLRSVDYFTLAENGDLYVKYSDSLNDAFKLGNINGLESIVINNNGIQVSYINGKYKQFNLKWIESIKLENQNDITKQQNFIVHYKDKTSDEVSQPINTILAIEMQGDNIVALYSDPVYRDNFSKDTENIKNKDWFLRPWTDPITGISYTDLVWINLTSPKGSYHVQGEYTYDDLKGIGTIDLSKGFGKIPDLRDRLGWLVTVQDINNKKIFAFDDNDKTENGKHTIKQDDGTTFTSHWYEIFSLADSAIKPGLLVAVSPASGTQPTLNNDGLWFMTYFGHDRI